MQNNNDNTDKNPNNYENNNYSGNNDVNNSPDNNQSYNPQSSEFDPNKSYGASEFDPNREYTASNDSWHNNNANYGSYNNQGTDTGYDQNQGYNYDPNQGYNSGYDQNQGYNYDPNQVYDQGYGSQNQYDGSYVAPDYDPYNPGFQPEGPNANTTPVESILSLVAGILSIILCCFAWVGLILGIAATVLGFLGMRKSNNEGYGGKALAIAGLSCGIIGGLLSLFSLVINAFFSSVATGFLPFYENYYNS